MEDQAAPITPDIEIDPVDIVAARVDELIGPPEAPRREELRPTMSTWDHAFNQLQQRVAVLIDTIEGQSKTAQPEAAMQPVDSPGETHTPYKPEAVEQSSVSALRALQTSREAERAELPLLIDRLKAKAEPPNNLSGILANLPEITAEQRAALSRVDHRLELMKVRTDATADALAGIVREIEFARAAIDELRRTTEVSRRTESELAANQRQMAESLNLLHDLVSRATEIVKSNAAWVEMLAEAPDKGHQALRDQMIAQSARVETRSTIGLVAAGVAALASIAAVVMAIKR